MPRRNVYFNYTCYEKCPEYTKELEEPYNGNDCVCNKDINAYWYEYIIDSKKLYFCGIKKCPTNNDDNNYNRSNEKQCLLSYKDTDYPASLRNIEKCPPSTKTNDDKCEVNCMI